MSNQKICDICGKVLDKSKNSTQYGIVLWERAKAKKEDVLCGEDKVAFPDFLKLMGKPPEYEEKSKCLDFCETHYKELQQIFFNMMKNIGKKEVPKCQNI